MRKFPLIILLLLAGCLSAPVPQDTPSNGSQPNEPLLESLYVMDVSRHGSSSGAGGNQLFLGAFRDGEDVWVSIDNAFDPGSIQLARIRNGTVEQQVVDADEDLEFLNVGAHQGSPYMGYRSGNELVLMYPDGENWRRVVLSNHNDVPPVLVTWPQFAFSKQEAFVSSNLHYADGSVRMTVYRLHEWDHASAPPVQEFPFTASIISYGSAALHEDRIAVAYPDVLERVHYVEGTWHSISQQTPKVVYDGAGSSLSWRKSIATVSAALNEEGLPFVDFQRSETGIGGVGGQQSLLASGPEWEWDVVEKAISSVSGSVRAIGDTLYFDGYRTYPLASHNASAGYTVIMELGPEQHCYVRFVQQGRGLEAVGIQAHDDGYHIRYFPDVLALSKRDACPPT